VTRNHPLCHPIPNVTSNHPHWIRFIIVYKVQLHIENKTALLLSQKIQGNLPKEERDLTETCLHRKILRSLEFRVGTNAKFYVLLEGI